MEYLPIDLVFLLSITCIGQMENIHVRDEFIQGQMENIRDEFIQGQMENIRDEFIQGQMENIRDEFIQGQMENTRDEFIQGSHHTVTHMETAECRPLMVHPRIAHCVEPTNNVNQAFKYATRKEEEPR